MKKLVALFAVLGFATSAYAAEGADFSHSGEFRLQYTNDMNQDGDDSATGTDSPDQNWHQRLRWGTTVRAGEKLSGHFTLVHNTDWGNNVGADTTTNQVPENPVVTGGTVQTNNILIVNEAYGTWVASDAWTLKFGRGAMTMADGRFVSTNDYEYLTKAFDGVLASWDHELARFNFFAVEGAKGVSTNTFGTFYGVAADFKSLPSFLKAAHLHVVQVKRDNGEYDIGAGASQNIGRLEDMKIGLMVSGEVAGADWRLNYEMQNGEESAYNTDTDTDIKASMIDAEVGYTLAAAMNTRIHLGYHMDSGDDDATDDEDNTYDGFHYDRHNNGGLMDLFLWGNLTYARLGFSLQPADDITVGAEYFMFTQTEKEDGTASKGNGGTASKGNGGTFATAATDADEDDLGTEIDVWVTKKYTNNFSITGRYGQFAPGDEFKNGPEDDYKQLYLEAKLTF